MYTTDFAYDGPIFLVPLSLSYPSSPVYIYEHSFFNFNEKTALFNLHAQVILVKGVMITCQDIRESLLGNIAYRSTYPVKKWKRLSDHFSDNLQTTH